MYSWAGSHNKLQRARVQPQAYKEGNIKGCNLSDQGSRTYTLGPKHTQDSRFDLSLNALMCRAEISGVQLGQHTAQLGTLEESEAF